MSESNEQLLRRYLARLNDKDMAGCMAFYADGSRICIRGQEHIGLPAIEAWHTERFGANFSALDLGKFSEKDGEASIEFQLSSDRTAGTRMQTLPATFIATIDGMHFWKAQIKLRPAAGLFKLFGLTTKS